MSSVSGAINSLNQSVNSFQSRIDSPIKNIYKSTVDINDNATKIYDGIEEFKQKMMLGEETQLAHENIIRIDQILKEQFSQHDAIRKTVMGIVRDFDINLVRNSTITELSEELWITSSRYWLSYAMIAITAWVNNYPEVAKNALSESGRRDSIKTTLFFCLMNIRFERVETARKWFCEYLKILDPKMLQQETAVVLQAFLNGIFGKDKALEHEVISLIDEWIRILNEDAEACEHLINEYQTYIEGLGAHDKFSYNSIAEFCENHDQVKKSFEDVSKYETILSIIESLDVENVEQTDDNYKERVDAVLMNLITKYDADELELRNQQSYWRFIVDNNGDKEKAQDQFEQYEELQNEHFNIGKQMIKWAIFDDDDTTDAQVRKFGFQNTKAWFSEALNRWDSKVAEAKPINYKLNIDTWSAVSTGSDQEEMTDNLKNYFETNKFHNMFINTINIALVIAIILSAGLAFVTLYSLVVTAIALGVLVFRVVMAIKKYPARVNAALENLSNTMAEIAEYNKFYDEKHSLKDEILSKVEFI